MNDQRFDISRSAAVAIANTCHDAVFAPPEDRQRFVEKICGHLDVIVAELGITRHPQIVDRGNRPVGFDFTIPCELKHVFSFIAGNTDGTLFVLANRPAWMQMYVDREDGVQYHFPPITRPLVQPQQLVRIAFEDPR